MSPDATSAPSVEDLREPQESERTKRPPGDRKHAARPIRAARPSGPRIPDVDGIPVSKRRQKANRDAKTGMTMAVWVRLLAAYYEKPTIGALATVRDDHDRPVALRTAQRALYEGFPTLGLPALREVQADPVRVLKRMHEDRIARADTDVQEEAVRQAADEAAAARAVLSGTLRLAEVQLKLAEEVLAKVRAGEVEIDKVTPRVLATLARSADYISAAVERAIRIDRLRTGQPEQVLGIQVGLQLDGLPPAELAYVQQTGRLPPRLLSLVQRRVVDTTSRPTNDATNDGALEGQGVGDPPAPTDAAPADEDDDLRRIVEDPVVPGPMDTDEDADVDADADVDEAT